MGKDRNSNKKRSGPPGQNRDDGSTPEASNDRGRGRGGERGGERGARRQRQDDREELDERVIDITRVAKVIKGGRRFAFRTVVVVGDNKGRIGIGIGKARAVPDSIRKASERARREIKLVSITEAGSIPFEMTGEYGGARVFIKPATPGTGVIAGGAVRAVLEVAGVSNILTKSQGSNNMLNVAMATLEAMYQLRSPQQTANIRGKELEDVLPFWERAALLVQRQSLEVVKAKQQAERAAQQEMTAGEIAAQANKGE
ncbi:MAG: 30S ribosomal protein S5 [Phototrophicaceae bacterium]|jgi:small subunit ribosomal protein S5